MKNDDAFRTECTLAELASSTASFTLVENGDVDAFDLAVTEVIEVPCEITLTPPSSTHSIKITSHNSKQVEECVLSPRLLGRVAELTVTLLVAMVDLIDTIVCVVALGLVGSLELRLCMVIAEVGSKRTVVVAVA